MNTQALNSKLEAYINLSEEEKQKKPMYKSDHFRLFDYPDGTSSIDLMNKKEINVGDDFRDHKGRLHVITEIVGYRPHKGVFTSEEKRHTFAIVKSEIIPGV